MIFFQVYNGNSSINEFQRWWLIFVSFTWIGSFAGSLLTGGVLFWRQLESWGVLKVFIERW